MAEPTPEQEETLHRLERMSNAIDEQITKLRKGKLDIDQETFTHLLRMFYPEAKFVGVNVTTAMGDTGYDSFTTASIGDLHDANWTEIDLDPTGFDDGGLSEVVVVVGMEYEPDEHRTYYFDLDTWAEVRGSA